MTVGLAASIHARLFHRGGSSFRCRAFEAGAAKEGDVMIGLNESLALRQHVKKSAKFFTFRLNVSNIKGDLSMFIPIETMTLPFFKRKPVRAASM